MPAAPAAAIGTRAPPMLLPGDAAAARVPAVPGRWLVGAQPRAPARRVAARFGARPLARGLGIFSVRRASARPLAAALRAGGLLRFAEPDVRARAAATPAEPLSGSTWWHDVVVDPSLTPPPVAPNSPELALIDSQADLSHPEWAGSAFTSLGSGPPADLHGTATAAVAAAPVNGIGIAGIWPGMRAVNLPTDLSCSSIVQLLSTAIQRRVATINMSYGGNTECFSEDIALQYAVASQIVLVAAAGNEFGEGNPLEFPASLPHVLTVASVGRDLKSSFFSNANAAIDVAAPGEEIVTAVPQVFDTEDGSQDGYAALDGTSFSAPMVSAAATWLRAARPDLRAGQVAEVLRRTARDLDRPGWDPNTGFGLIDLKAALAGAAPPVDPLEPNDEIYWVDGTAFNKPDKPIFRGATHRVSFSATLDQYEDPIDVYRVTLPRRSRLRISAKPRYGDADLAVYGRRARSVQAGRHRLAGSHHDGRRTDAVEVVNRSRRAHTVYVETYIDASVRNLVAGYRLTVTRLAFR